jgi:hypothetical protein
MKYTPETARVEMQKVLDELVDDTERRHARADRLLCEILKQHGFEETVLLFQDMEKWYA